MQIMLRTIISCWQLKNSNRSKQPLKRPGYLFLSKSLKKKRVLWQFSVIITRYLTIFINKFFHNSLWSSHSVSKLLWKKNWQLELRYLFLLFYQNNYMTQKNVQFYFKYMLKSSEGFKRGSRGTALTAIPLRWSVK